MLIQTACSEELDHDFNVPVDFEVPSICTGLFVEICNRHIGTHGVKSECLGKNMSMRVNRPGF